MSKINSFQDLEVWKEAHRLVLEVYKIIKKFPREEIYSIVSQIRRAAISIPCNIAEGMGRRTTKDFINFLHNARGSLQETIYLLILSKDLGYIKQEEFDILYSRYNGLGAGINSFISKLKEKVNSQ